MTQTETQQLNYKDEYYRMAALSYIPSSIVSEDTVPDVFAHFRRAPSIFFWMWLLTTITTTLVSLLGITHAIKLLRVSLRIRRDKQLVFLPTLADVYLKIFLFFPLIAVLTWSSLLAIRFALMFQLLLHLYEVGCLLWFWELMAHFLGGPEMAYKLLHLTTSLTPGVAQQLVKAAAKLHSPLSLRTTPTTCSRVLGTSTLATLSRSVGCPSLITSSADFPRLSSQIREPNHAETNLTGTLDPRDANAVLDSRTACSNITPATLKREVIGDENAVYSTVDTPQTQTMIAAKDPTPNLVAHTPASQHLEPRTSTADGPNSLMLLRLLPLQPSKDQLTAQAVSCHTPRPIRREICPVTGHSRQHVRRGPVVSPSCEDRRSFDLQQHPETSRDSTLHPITSFEDILLGQRSPTTSQSGSPSKSSRLHDPKRHINTFRTACSTTRLPEHTLSYSETQKKEQRPTAQNNASTAKCAALCHTRLWKYYRRPRQWRQQQQSQQKVGVPKRRCRKSNTDSLVSGTISSTNKTAFFSREISDTEDSTDTQDTLAWSHYLTTVKFGPYRILSVFPFCCLPFFTTKRSFHRADLRLSYALVVQYLVFALLAALSRAISQGLVFFFQVLSLMSLYVAMYGLLLLFKATRRIIPRQECQLEWKLAAIKTAVFLMKGTELLLRYTPIVKGYQVPYGKATMAYAWSSFLVNLTVFPIAVISVRAFSPDDITRRYSKFHEGRSDMLITLLSSAPILHSQDQTSLQQTTDIAAVMVRIREATPIGSSGTTSQHKIYSTDVVTSRQQNHPRVGWKRILCLEQ